MPGALARGDTTGLRAVVAMLKRPAKAAASWLAKELSLASLCMDREAAEAEKAAGGEEVVVVVVVAAAAAAAVAVAAAAVGAGSTGAAAEGGE